MCECLNILYEHDIILYMNIMLGKYQLHYGEEPCISGRKGSGTIFFCGCRLGCVFCQNAPISRHGVGEKISVARLADIFKELEDKGAHNINLVTGEHYADEIIEAFNIYRPKVPVVWNSGGYESIETLRKLEPYVDIYLPDLKYADPELAAKFSGPSGHSPCADCTDKSDYPKVAIAAIHEMLNQKGNPEFDEDGMMTKGVLIRHLALPLHIRNTEQVLDVFNYEFPGAWLSLMLQYTPVEMSKYPELNRKLTERECNKVLRLLEESGIENGFMQDREAAGEMMIPKWNE